MNQFKFSDAVDCILVILVILVVGGRERRCSSLMTAALHRLHPCFLLLLPPPFNCSCQRAADVSFFLCPDFTATCCTSTRRVALCGPWVYLHLRLCSLWSQSIPNDELSSNLGSSPSKTFSSFAGHAVLYSRKLESRGEKQMKMC